MARRVVVLPQPLGPSRQTNSPDRISSETRSKISRSPYRTVTSFSRTSPRPAFEASAKDIFVSILSAFDCGSHISSAATSDARELANVLGTAASEVGCKSSASLHVLLVPLGPAWKAFIDHLKIRLIQARRIRAEFFSRLRRTPNRIRGYTKCRSTIQSLRLRGG